ncbi:transcriptional regulator [Candidatus Woesearchaeota archaeon]|nr:transcriptional regulator [Candidatus Woesearchaeota archaeon]
MATEREKIEQLLKKETLSARELAQRLDIDIADVIEDLRHVRKSTQPPLKFKIHPARCNHCGFIFKERTKVKTPSKCPSCRSESITEARYSIG